jgi:hypothetical protein
MGICISFCKAGKQGNETFEDHFRALTNHAILEKMVRGNRRIMRSLPYIHFVKMVETHPFGSVFFHKKSKGFSQRERCVAFVGFIALSTMITAMITHHAIRELAHFDCLDKRFVGCEDYGEDAWVDDTSSIRTCVNYAYEAESDFHHFYVNTTYKTILYGCLQLHDNEGVGDGYVGDGYVIKNSLPIGCRTMSDYALPGNNCNDPSTWGHLNLSLAQAKQSCEPPGGLLMWLTLQFAGPIFQYVFFGAFVSWVLKKERWYLNPLAYSIIVLQAAVACLDLAEISSDLSCNRLGDVRGKRHGVYTTIATNFLWQLFVMCPLTSLGLSILAQWDDAGFKDVDDKWDEEGAQQPTCNIAPQLPHLTQVAVPPGMGPGQILSVASSTPGGAPIQVQIPQGVTAGMVFEFPVPTTAVEVSRQGGGRRLIL